MSWTLARSLNTLRNEFDRAHPNRPKASDGTVGDTAHGARTSDHNPDGYGIVRAWDCTALDESRPHPLAEYLLASRDRRLKYVISRGRMFASYETASRHAWTWGPYTGINGHFHHCHVSVIAGTDGNDPRPWGYPAGLDVPTVKPPVKWVAPPFPGRTLRLGSVGDDVAAWKLLLIAAGHGGTVSVKGREARIFGPGTATATRALMKDYYRVKQIVAPVPIPAAVGPKAWAWACDVVTLRKAQGL